MCKRERKLSKLKKKKEKALTRSWLDPTHCNEPVTEFFFYFSFLFMAKGLRLISSYRETRPLSAFLIATWITSLHPQLHFDVLIALITRQFERKNPSLYFSQIVLDKKSVGSFFAPHFLKQLARPISSKRPSSKHWVGSCKNKGENGGDSHDSNCRGLSERDE